MKKKKLGVLNEGWRKDRLHSSSRVCLSEHKKQIQDSMEQGTTVQEASGKKQVAGGCRELR
jgi:hypothetical protein